MSSKVLKRPLEPDSLPEEQPAYDSDDDLSSPECVLSLQPVEDDYSSDDEARKKTTRQKEHDDDNDTCAKTKEGIMTRSRSKHSSFSSHCVRMTCSDVRKSFIESHFKAEYTTSGPLENVLFSGAITLKDVLEEMFYFALQEDTARMTTDEEGTHKYGGKSVDDIIIKWKNESCDAAWILQNFEEDLTLYNRKLGVSANQLLSSKPSIKTATMSEIQSSEIRLTFMKRICEVLVPSVITKQSCITTQTKPSCDEVLEQNKPLLAQFANLTAVSYRFNGECKFISEIFDPFKGEATQIVTKPDFLFETYSKILTVPVEVYGPATDNVHPAESTRIGSILNILNYSQKYDEQEKLNGQHIMQLIAALHHKLKYVVKCEEDDNLVQVGMFMTKKYIKFSKITTTKRHLSSRFPDLLPRDLYLLPAMMQRQKEKGLKVVVSNWYIDLSKAIHRNAFIIFISEFFHGQSYP